MNLRSFSRYWLLVPLILAAILARDWSERPDTFELEETVDMRATEADYYLEDFVTRRFDANGALEYRVSGETLSHYPDDDRSEVEAPRVELHRGGALWRMRAERGRLDTEPDVLTLLGKVVLERESAPAAAGNGAPAPDVAETVEAPSSAGGEGDAAAASAASAVLPPDAPADAVAAPVRAAPRGDAATRAQDVPSPASSEPASPPRTDRPDPFAGGPFTLRTADLSLGLDTDELATDAAFEIVAEHWRLAGTGLRSNIDAGKLVLLSDVSGTYDVAVPE